MICPNREILTSCGGRLAGVDVADNDDVDMDLFLTAKLLSALVLISFVVSYRMLTP